MPAPSSRTDSDSDFQRAARSHAEIRSIVIGLMLAILLGALDQTIVSVALPRIAQQLRDFDLLAWVVSGYLVAVAVATPIYGKIGDLVGRRATLSFAIGLFLLASVACALAQSMPMLVAARILQGLGGGGLISVAQAIIADVVAPRERGRYQGYVSGMYAIASVVGPLAGGVLTHYLSWRWIFWINLPLGAAALLISRRALATLPVPRVARRIDYPGAVLLSAGLAMLLIAVTRVGQGVAWAAPLNLALFGASAAVLSMFTWHETRAPEPILPLSLFRIPTVTLCCGVLFVAFFQVIALSVLVPLQLEMSTGVGADGAAVRLVPLTLAIPLGAFVGGRMTSRVGRARPFQLAGTALVPPAVLAIALIDPRMALPATLAMIAAGFGIGLQFPTSMVTVQSAVPARHIGVATATTAFFRSLGAAVGVAILTAILLASLQAHAPAGAPVSGGEFLHHVASGIPQTGEAAQSIRDAFRKIFSISAAVALVSFCLTLRLRDETLSDRLAH